VILFDVDDFKAINDTFGHIVGNKILKQFAASLQNFLFQDAIIARLGGDEFVVIIKEDETRAVNLDFIDKIKYQEYVVDPDLATITVEFSYGITLQSTTPLKGIQELVNLADQNMYCNKASRGISVNISNVEAAVPEKYQEIIHVLAQKDVYTYVHSLHVARYGAILAETMGLNAEEVANIFLAGWLHDLGKIAIPNEILRKPGKLGDAEYQLIKKHVFFGMNLLNTFDINDSISKAIANHHERCDGQGYPNGFLNHQIPIEGRILAIVDAFSAMTVKRVYCERLTELEAVQELKRGKGLQFDPELVERFSGIIEGGSQKVDLVYS
jgi:diguanylate cyclase (GGDEF)-like protein/putative nucleotidyltransferase with HDIG domain